MTARARLLSPALATLTLAAAAATAAPASAAVQPIPVRPLTYFTGLVNGAASPAEIRVACPGPVIAGRTTHPLSGQSVQADAIFPPSTAAVGYTGSAGTALDVVLTSPVPTTANPPIVLGSFFTPAPIPTSWTVPCSGTGTLSFVPVPTSPTARPLNLTVTFVNIAVSN